MREQHRCFWLRWFAPLIAGAALISLAVAPSANATPPRYECPPRIANCTTVTGAWIDVPRGGLSGAFLVYDQVTCPSGEPVGYSYEGGNEAYTWVLVQVFQNHPYTSNPWNGATTPGTVFFLINNIGGATTVRDRIGCAPATALGPVRVLQRERTWTATLKPSQARTYRHGCSRGRHLVQGDATVEFLTQDKPSLAELTAVKWRDRVRGNSETVRVTTTARLGSSARAVLKMSLFCDA